MCLIRHEKRTIIRYYLNRFHPKPIQQQNSRQYAHNPANFRIKLVLPSNIEIDSCASHVKTRQIIVEAASLVHLNFILF